MVANAHAQISTIAAGYIFAAILWTVGYEVIKGRRSRRSSGLPVQTGVMLVVYYGGWLILIAVGICFIVAEIVSQYPSH